MGGWGEGHEGGEGLFIFLNVTLLRVGTTDRHVSGKTINRSNRHLLVSGFPV